MNLKLRTATMASTIPLPLMYLTLFLLLAQFTHSAPIPRHKNHTEHEHQPSSNTYIVHANYLAKPSQFATHKHWYTSMVATHSPRAEDSSSRILYTYDTVMQGFAVQLTVDEAQRMSSSAGVTGVYEDRRLHRHTTRTPSFLGLDPGFGAWRDTDFGDGVIIGIVDTGIWPESASFNDNGLGPVRPSWRGRCADTEDFSSSLCNNKLVGAKAFGAASKGSGVPSPRDTDGHGTHVASTAAGSEVRDAGILMFARGTARGVAPKAKIAMYTVLGLSSANIVAALDAAVKDGVDILSMSFGDDTPSPFHSDAIAIAAFGADRKGVFVVLSGGNDGPYASTVTNVAPWMTTVGATTVDRLFPASLILGNSEVLSGQSLYTMKTKGTTMVSIVFSSCYKDDLTPENIMGKIVVCVGVYFSPEIVMHMLPEVHGAGLVLMDNSSWSTDGVFAVGFTFPNLMLSHTAGEKLRAYMAISAYPVASFSFACETVIGENRAPMVASFSSRGPNLIVPELLKPDVIAPGLNILAAWIDDTTLANRRKDNYKIDSGTSMSCPHVAGVAALIKKKHSTWTPAMMRSALMTTAGTLDNTDREILDDGVTEARGDTVATPFAAGAGHVRPQLAMDPDLVYDIGTRDYVDFLCALNYTIEQLRRFAPDLTRCTRALPCGPTGLNYPSFVVVFDGRTDVRTQTRTVTKVSEKAETYKVRVVAPEHVKVTVRPAILEFEEQYEKRSYTVEFRSEAGGIVKAGWEFGHIIWENKKRQVRSPLAIMWKN